MECNVISDAVINAWNLIFQIFLKLFLTNESFRLLISVKLDDIVGRVTLKEWIVEPIDIDRTCLLIVERLGVIAVNIREVPRLSSPLLPL